MTYDVNTPYPNKILVINDVSNFDIFTDKYAYIHAGNGCDVGILLIDWAKVKKDYKGVKIESDSSRTRLYHDRFLNAPYKGYTFISWWDADFYDRIFL